MKIRTVNYAGPSAEGGSCTNAPDPLVANYVKPNAAGLVVYECKCGGHVWAVPWDEDLARWIGHLRSPLRSYIEAKGMAPKEPHPKPHVIIASHEDAHLLKMRRWKVFPAKKGHRVKHHLKSGTRGLPLQRMIHPKAEAITFDNCNGLDVRRENLRRTTIRKLLRARDERRRKARKTATLNSDAPGFSRAISANGSGTSPGRRGTGKSERRSRRKLAASARQPSQHQRAHGNRGRRTYSRIQ